MDVVEALAGSIDGYTSAELARRCGITTSTCALVLAELERGGWVARYDDRRYGLGSGLFGVVHGLRRQFPLLDRGRDALVELHERLGAGCSMSKIGDRHLTTVDTVGMPPTVSMRSVIASRSIRRSVWWRWRGAMTSPSRTGCNASHHG